MRDKVETCPSCIYGKVEPMPLSDNYTRFVLFMERGDTENYTRVHIKYMTSERCQYPFVVCGATFYGKPYGIILPKEPKKSKFILMSNLLAFYTCLILKKCKPA